MRRTALSMLVLAALLLPTAALAAQAGGHSPAPVATAAGFDKTKFVFDLGTASYAIHHFIYLPYKANHIKGIKAKLKAAAAAAFAYNRLKAAYNVANHGNSKLLHRIVAPLNALIGQVQALAGKLRHGSTSGVTAANATLGSLSGAARSAGAPFKDVATSV